MSSTQTDDAGTVDAARETASDVAQTAAEQGKQVAGTVAEQASTVAQEARQQVGSLTGEARDQAQRVVSQTTNELGQQLEQRLGKAVEAARGMSGDLSALAQGRPQDAGRTADLVEQAGHHLGALADRIEDLGPQGVVDEVTDFARRRPLVFLAGAVAAGVVVGRLAKSGGAAASAAAQQDAGPSTGSLAEGPPPGVGSGGAALPAASQIDAPLGASTPAIGEPGSAQPLDGMAGEGGLG